MSEPFTATAGPVLIIANPASGRGRGMKLAAAVGEHLRRRGIEIQLAYTSGRGDARQRALDGCRHGHDALACVAACGGDGTVQEVADALAAIRAERGDAAPALGLIPAGRCNDFARALSIPRTAEGMADTIAGGRRVRLDLGRVSDRHFCTVATLGLDAEVTGFVERMRMPLRGTVAYIYGAVRVLMRYRPPVVRLEGDFGVIEQAVFLASTANTFSYGGAIPIAPGASPTDGELDLCVIDALPRRRALAMIPRVLLGRHGGRREVRLLRTRRLRIDADAPLQLWADGEPVGRTPLEIAVAAGAINAIVPTGGAAR
ncbi:MAG: diacylglycerol kinase family lipid kinase [Planctomycetes bacterium]|nr:diacylglycerol kinase family lipid kinase [Planctomycetota bacterium]